MACLLNLFQHTTIMGMYIKYRDIFFDLNISEFQKMSSHNKYIELTDELQFTKKELANYRQKYQISTQQLASSEEEIRNLKKIIVKLEDTTSKLHHNNQILTDQKQEILSDFSTSVQSIKEEITKKQHQIEELKQITTTKDLTSQLFKKHLRAEIEHEFQQQIEQSSKKVEEITLLQQKLNYEQNMEQEKSKLKIENLENQIKEMQKTHIIQIQDYANRLYQMSLQRPSYEEKNLQKKMKKELEEARIKSHLAQDELTETIEEKYKLQKQYSTFIEKHATAIQQNQEELRIYKLQCERLSELQERNSKQKDGFLMREKEKDVKKLRSQLESLNEESMKKERRISNLQIQLHEQQVLIKKLKTNHQEEQNESEAKLQRQNQILQRQLGQNRNSLQNMMSSYQQLNEKFMQLSITIPTTQSQFKNKIIIEDLKGKQKNSANNDNMILNTSFSEKQMHKTNKKTLQLNNQTQSQVQKLFEAEKHKYEGKIQQEKARVKEVLQNYLELKRKYANLQKKFNQANSKVVDLLKTKIQLGSPTAASRKHIEFPSQYKVQHFDGETLSKNFFERSPEHASMTGVNNLKIHHPRTEQAHTIQGNRPYLSPQQTTHAERRLNSPLDEVLRSEKSKEKDSNTTFYEKSLKIKSTHKYKELKCNNHSNHHDHTCN